MGRLIPPLNEAAFPPSLENSVRRLFSALGLIVLVDYLIP
jgi:hypothetical protein